ncbi:MAG: hypothetical protein HYX34_03410 [Actinobacteria bacterium]|nr:hypothetical protein [Actinomycetota bacterium]
MKIRKAFIAVLGVTAALLFMAGPAGAQYPPGGGPTVTVDDTVVQAGEVVNVGCEGFAPGSTVTVTLGGQVLQTFNTGPDGAGCGAVTIPANLCTGTYSLVSTGQGSDGSTVSRTITLSITGRTCGAVGGTGGGLARTGTDSIVPLTLVGASMLVIGLALATLTWRKRSAQA